LEERFPETAETQPELLAHHFTEAGLKELAVGYWQQAGEKVIGRYAYVETISHLTKGLEILRTLPDTPKHAQRELDMLVTLGPALLNTKGLVLFGPGTLVSRLFRPSFGSHS
jgi:predicted ATPase